MTITPFLLPKSKVTERYDKAKSWGKVKDDSDIATVIGDVTIMFPLAMMYALEELENEGLLT